MPKPSRKTSFLPRSPWVCFLIFLSSNTLLSYFSFPLEVKLAIGTAGLALPLLWFWRKSPSTTGILDQREFLPPIPLWGWGLLGLLAVAARFSCLTTLFVWPNFDESSYGFDAFQLADHVPPRLFYGVSQAPPLFIWGLALFFKIFGISLATLRFFPALVSLVTVPLAYWAARTSFSRSFSFLCAVLAAGSFWPVFVGRFSLMTILILPMELLALGCVGKFFQAKDANARIKAAWGIGMVWGIGLYTHLHWPVVVAITGLPLAYWVFKNFRERPAFVGSLAARALGLALLLDLPLLGSALQQHYGGYLGHLWAFHPGFSWEEQLAVWASCLTSPFWGMDINVHTYQPQWGGFLNSTLSSLFFLGILKTIRSWSNPLSRFLGTGYLLCLLPGLLTQDMETFRLFPMVPILIMGSCLGCTILLEDAKPWKNLVWVLVLFLLSMTLDAIHLFGFYHRIWNDSASWGFYTKSVGRYRAYDYLEQRRKKEGIGLVFQDFVQGLPDQSLTVATYSYNAVLNPRLSLSQARWAAVLANVNYQSFLKSRFSDGTAYALSRDFPTPDGGWMLFVFSLDEKRRKEMELWCKAQRALESFEDVNLCYVMGQPFDRDLESLRALEPFFRGDLFLRAAFFEKEADLETKQFLLETGEGEKRMIPKKTLEVVVSPAIQSLKKAVTEGYPAAHLYFHLGDLWMMGQNPAEAKKAFQKAIQAPLNLTESSRYLTWLGASPVLKAQP